MSAERVLMTCGHASNATVDGKPYCAICDRSDPAPTPDLTGRKACCLYCFKREPSSLRLPYFGHNPQQPEDTFYCGCRGWD